MRIEVLKGFRLLDARLLAGALAWLNGWIAAYTVGCARLVSAVPFAQASGRDAALAAVGALACGAYAWWRWRTSFSRPI